MAEDKREPGWYLALMAPNSKGSEFLQWLDTTAMYRNAEAFHQCVADLTKDFQPDEVDLVAGIDATGFILGGAIACHLKKGFLAIRKYGNLCVEVDDVRFKDYSKKEKRLEIRKDAFKPGTKVLIVDQWIETGGTMAAAVELVERQQGIVAGIACVCIEESEGGKRLMEKYKCVSCVASREIQDQVNAHNLESCKAYKPL
ncbi:adenine phosphoribosyltransferase-like [Branchiostoma lanceolatum]|uniref:adenine phosphoribosyltransferase-like n=1 Tax=Branchiostoma lanceolatum TaxID=7740 RepID=UPI00345611DD